MFYRFLYNLFLPLLWLGFRILGVFNRKVAAGIRGRRGLFRNLEEQLSRLRPGRRRIWFHSASLGEFEQAKPIIGELRRRHNDLDIIVSFFSPSGYEHVRSSDFADLVTYVPFDSPGNARRFVRMLNPSTAVFLRYDVWPNHLGALRRLGAPTFVVSATIRSAAARRIPPIRAFYRSLYNMLDYVLASSEPDKQVFEAMRLTHPVLDVVGDTRYDQVVARSQASRQRPVLAGELVRGRKVFVIGSSWKEDEDVLVPACCDFLRAHDEFLVVVAPHEPTPEHLDRLERLLGSDGKVIRYSILPDYGGEPFIIIDNVGMLMSLYQHAHIAYVGGGFRTGIHNVLEPAAYGIPILIGPDHGNSREAMMLVDEGAAFVGQTGFDFYQHLERLLGDERTRDTAGGKALAHVCGNTGATAKFIEYLEREL